MTSSKWMLSSEEKVVLGPCLEAFGAYLTHIRIKLHAHLSLFREKLWASVRKLDKKFAAGM